MLLNVLHLLQWGINCSKPVSLDCIISSFRISWWFDYFLLPDSLKQFFKGSSTSGATENCFFRRDWRKEQIQVTALQNNTTSWELKFDKHDCSFLLLIIIVHKLSLFIFLLGWKIKLYCTFFFLSQYKFNNVHLQSIFLTYKMTYQQTTLWIYTTKFMVSVISQNKLKLVWLLASDLKFLNKNEHTKPNYNENKNLQLPTRVHHPGAKLLWLAE